MSIPDREAQSLGFSLVGPERSRGLHQGGSAAGTDPSYGPSAGTGTSPTALEKAAPFLPGTELQRKPSAFLLRGGLVSGKHRTSLAALLLRVSWARRSGCHRPWQSQVAWPV